MAQQNEERHTSIATDRNADILYSATQPTGPQGSWLERKLRPKTVSARYPFTGKLLLFATCGFGSLGDALFGYNSGEALRMTISCCNALNDDC
jgi:hypothetical protein